MAKPPARVPFVQFHTLPTRSRLCYLFSYSEWSPSIQLLHSVPRCKHALRLLNAEVNQRAQARNILPNCQTADTSVLKGVHTEWRRWQSKADRICLPLKVWRRKCRQGCTHFSSALSISRMITSESSSQIKYTLIKRLRFRDSMKVFNLGNIGKL